MKSKSSIAVWCAGSFCLGAVLTALVFHATSTQPPPLELARNNLPASRGPWGNLEALEIPLGDSADLFVDRDARLQPTRWFFERFSKEQLETLLRSCDLTPAQWGLLQQTNVVNIALNGIILTPPDEFVWALSAAARGKIYTTLAQTEANYSQSSPFCFTPDRFAERLAQAGLSPEIQRRIRSLSYTNAGFVRFSDLQLLPAILSTNELNRVSEALYRVPTYRLRLRVFPDSDTEAIVKYWGRHEREKRIRPLLESLVKVPARSDGVSLNISYLLPPTARLRLYTYPNAWPDAEAERQDCFWTALNFFRDPPDPAYLDSRRNKEVLDTEYHLIDAAPTFGDVIVLVGAKGNGLHACIYIADDFVFTKNGINHLQPWVLMKLNDMRAVFATQGVVRTAIFRSNEVLGNMPVAAPVSAEKPSPSPVTSKSSTTKG